MDVNERKSDVNQRKSASEVRLLSVRARGFFLAASRLAFAVKPFNSLNEKKPLAPRVVDYLTDSVEYIMQ